MKIQVFETKEEAAKAAFERIQKDVKAGHVHTLGLATGGTPLMLYKYMRESKLDVSGITTVNLDEYVGMPADDPHSYHAYMEEEVFSHLSFKESYLPDGMAGDLSAECSRYEKILNEHPVDIQVLGIGPNGHIGFNEPGTPFDSVTHVVDLTESTREANKRYFEREEDVPKQALSMGIKSILSANKIILLAFGNEKAQAVKQMAEGKVEIQLPASILQTHPNVEVFADSDAASLLKEGHDSDR